jgi:hypothetical protein
MRPIDDTNLISFGFTCPYTRWVNGSLGLWVQYSIKNKAWEIYQGSTLVKEGMQTLEELQIILESYKKL